MSKKYIIKSGARIPGTTENETKTKTDVFSYVLCGQMEFTNGQLKWIDEDKYGKFYQFVNNNFGTTEYTISSNYVTEVKI